MPIPSVSREELVKAMAAFDRNFRGRGEWENWIANGAYRYAIEHQEQMYPVKMIISLATGSPRTSFYGGHNERAANQYVRERGLRVVSIRSQNPDWLRDELILALELYLKNRELSRGPEGVEIQELSQLLNSMGPTLHGATYEKFRNPNGVYMKLLNFRRLDPLYPAEMALQHGSKLDEEIWEQFGSSPKRCEQAATSIRSAFAEIGRHPGWLERTIEEDEIEAAEGKLVARVHLIRERDGNLVLRKKTQASKKFGCLACEACGFDFGSFYGQRGNGYMECHHERPVHSMKPGDKTKISDLRLVCSNCHRMIHTRRPWLTVEELKALI